MADHRKLLDRACPNCRSRMTDRLKRYDSAHLVRCRHCRLVFAGTVPSAPELDEYYARYPPARAMTPLTRQRYDEVLQSFEPLRQTGRLLDVGCGDGDFLAAARERGWSVYGSEYGSAPLQRATARSLDVRPAPFQATPDELGSFDVVTSIEVIEHVVTPHEEAERMVRLLRPGGFLYLTTPNFNSISRRIAGPRWRVIEYPEHLNLFTPQTLDRMLSTLGLVRVVVKTTGVSPADILAAVKPAASDGRHVPPSAIDERVRDQIVASRRLELAVRAANQVLSWSSSGDTIKALYRRGPRRA